MAHESLGERGDSGNESHLPAEGKIEIPLATKTAPFLRDGESFSEFVKAIAGGDFYRGNVGRGDVEENYKERAEKFFYPDVLALRAVHLVNVALEDAGVLHQIEAVGLDTNLHVAEQRFERKRVITIQKKLALRKLQGDRRLRAARNGQRFYEYSAGVYDGYGVALPNLARVMGLASVEKLLFREDGVPATVLELAAGNAHLSQKLLEVFEELDPLLRLRHKINNIKTGEEDKIFDYIKRELLYTQLPSHQKAHLYHYITAIDYAQPFVDRWQYSGVQGVCADICAPPHKFLKTTQLKPHSVDYIFKFMALDRIPDLEACIRNIKLCARTDGSTDVVFGSIFPLSHRSDSDSQSPNIPRLQFWDPQTDPRRFCMGLQDPDESMELSENFNYHRNAGGLSKKLDQQETSRGLDGNLERVINHQENLGLHNEERDAHSAHSYQNLAYPHPTSLQRNSSSLGLKSLSALAAESQRFNRKAQAIANFCLYLESRGFKVEHISVQPSYEAVNVHCIVETAVVIRRDYAHLQQHEFFDPELNALRDKIFSGEVLDDELICIPQEYKELVLVHAKVTKPI